MAKKTKENAPASALSPVRAVADDELAEILQEKGWQTAPQVVSLDVGEMIQGTLIGPGPELEHTDQAGDKKMLKTWLIDCGEGVTGQLISSHQLDKELPDLKGRLVRIVKGEPKRVNGKQVNTFVVQHREVAA